MIPESTYLTDHFLIAMPSLADPNFARTVTYICQHGADGALGIVINRPTEMHLAEIFQQIDIRHHDSTVGALPVYAGGPVHADRGFILHSPPDSWYSTLRVTPELALTTSRDILEAMAEGRGPGKALVALGYAGWGSGQLEQEILDNAWLSCPADPDILWETQAADRWKAAVERIGVDLSLLSTQAGHG